MPSIAERHRGSRHGRAGTHPCARTALRITSRTSGAGRSTSRRPRTGGRAARRPGTSSARRDGTRRRRLASRSRGCCTARRRRTARSAPGRSARRRYSIATRRDSSSRTHRTNSAPPLKPSRASPAHTVPAPRSSCRQAASTRVVDRRGRRPTGGRALRRRRTTCRPPSCPRARPTPLAGRRRPGTAPNALHGGERLREQQRLGPAEEPADGLDELGGRLGEDPLFGAELLGRSRARAPGRASRPRCRRPREAARCRRCPASAGYGSHRRRAARRRAGPCPRARRRRTRRGGRRTRRRLRRAPARSRLSSRQRTNPSAPARARFSSRHRHDRADSRAMAWSPDRDALRGRVAVVAGATRGAGRGIAAALGEAGATVVCTGRTTRDAARPSTTAPRRSRRRPSSSRSSAAPASRSRSTISTRTRCGGSPSGSATTTATSTCSSTTSGAASC